MNTSKMATLNYKKLEEAYKNSPFTREQWLDSAEYWESQTYLSPILGLLGKTITRWVNTNLYKVWKE